MDHSNDVSDLRKSTPPSLDTFEIEDIHDLDVNAASIFCSSCCASCSSCIPAH